MSGIERVYGLHAVRALLERHPQRVQRVLLQTAQPAARGGAHAGRGEGRGAGLEALARERGVAMERVDAARFKTLLGDVVHQGVLAEVLPLAPWREDDLFAALQERTDPLLLALDGVQDPHNLGACLRTADACGVLAVIVPKDRAAPLNATARKVAAGAAETTPVVTVTNLSRTLQLLKEGGCWIVGAAAEAAQAAHQVDLTGPRVLVMGAEGHGLRELTRRHCDWLVSLPSLGAVESLNVSVASGMLLYEAVRQRQAAAGPKMGPASR